MSDQGYICGICKNVVVLDFDTDGVLKSAITHDCLKDHLKYKIVGNEVHPDVPNNGVNFYVSERGTGENSNVIPPIQPCQKWAEEMEEFSIDLVKERPPLWDFRLPLTERAPAKISLLWNEIKNIIQGQYPDRSYLFEVHRLINKQKNLRDTLGKKIEERKKKRQTGSAGGAQDALWKHELQMAFIAETLENKNTYSNMDTQSAAGQAIARRSRKKQPENNDFEALTNAITGLEKTASATAPDQPEEYQPQRKKLKNEGLQSFLYAMGLILDGFPKYQVEDAMLYIHKIVRNMKISLRLRRLETETD